MALFLILCGCAANKPSTAVKAPYLGPTQPMSEVIAEINRNNLAIRSLWARHYYEATFLDEKKQPHFVNGDGILLFLKPMDLRLVGTKPAVGTIFEIGSTAERYWMKVVPESDTLWWGKYRNLGKPCVQEIPVRPDLILQVLGVSDIDTNFNEQPVPVMRFNPDEDAYMFLWTVHAPDRWIAQKEVRYDRVTKHPKMVLLFDDNGRVVLRAYLSQFQPVEIPDTPKERWPVVATDYRLFFPDSRTKMSFQLSHVRAQNRGVPRPGSIRFPDEPGVSRVIQIDKDCD
jgi:hypothetical protein